MAQNRSRNKSKEQGFTLVELSIVLVIMGLLVGGVLAGRSLIHSAEVNGTISDLKEYVIAYKVFRDRYNCVPGDCIHATRYFDEIDNGDGDGLIDCAAPSAGCTAPTDEQVMAIKELRLAKLLSGDDVSWNSNALLIETKLRNCRVQYYSSYLYGNEANNLRIFALNPGITDCLTPEEAYDMDRKIDDGNPSMGIALGRRMNGNPQSECVSTNHWNPPSKDAQYNVQNDDIMCSLFVRF